MCYEVMSSLGPFDVTYMSVAVWGTFILHLTLHSLFGPAALTITFVHRAAHVNF